MHRLAVGADTTVARPTQLIAEALLDQHDSLELASRAKRLGFSRDLTEAVVKVCCREGEAPVRVTATPTTS